MLGLIFIYAVRINRRVLFVEFIFYIKLNSFSQRRVRSIAVTLINCFLISGNYFSSYYVTEISAGCTKHSSGSRFEKFCTVPNGFPICIKLLPFVCRLMVVFSVWFLEHLEDSTV